MDHITLPGLNVIRSFEGRALRAYKDSVGVWTVGYGLTHFDKGLPFTVGPGLVITADQAESLLVKSLVENYEPAVRHAIPQGWPRPAAFDAGTSFHFNTGGISKASWPARLNAGDMSATEANLKAWNKAGGLPLSGLTRRRAREWEMVANSNYGPEGHTGPDEIGVSANGFEVATNRRGEVLAVMPGAPLPADATKTGAVVPIAPTPAPNAVPGLLYKGFVGADVSEIQRELAALGYMPKGARMQSGVYDDVTERAVYDFQSHHPNLTADGIVGPATRAQFARDMLMRSAAQKGTAGVVVATGAAASVWGTIGTIAVVATCVAIVIGVYLAIKYPDEMQRNLNRLLGRVVP